MNNIIAIDLDGTLLDNRLNISDENIKYLELAKKKGFEIIICTGRPYNGMVRFLKQINRSIEIVKYLVLLNGASIYNLDNKEYIMQNYLDSCVVKKAVELATKFRNKNINLVGMNNKQFITIKSKNISKELIEDARKNNMEITYVENNEFVNKNDINKIFYIGDYISLNEVQEELKNIFSDKVYSVRSSGLIYEVLPLGINKGSGLETLINQFKVDCNIISIGDELNDLPMFEISNTKIAMGNSNEIVKQKADFITYSNDDSGVSKAVEWILDNRKLY